MTDPVDPNEPPSWTPPETPYVPPPPFGRPPQGQSHSAHPSSAPPYGHPPGYGQQPPPAYGQPPAHGQPLTYGQPPAYGQPGYPPPGGTQPYLAGYPPMYQGEAYLAPPRKSRTKLWVALAVVAMLAVAGVTASIVSDTSPKHKVTLPDSIGSYTRLQGTAAQTIEKRMKDFGGATSGSAMFQIATVGAYGADTGDVPNLIAVLISTKDIPGQSNRTAQDTVDLMFVGVSGPGMQPRTEAPGSHGGVVQCIAATFGAAQESLCGWSDSKTTGILVSVNPALPTTGLDALLETLRDKID